MSQLPIAKLKSKSLVNQDPDLIINHVTNGGTLTSLAKMLGCDYSEIMNQIRKDESLNERYKQALEDRKEWGRERILEELQYLSAYNIQDAVNIDGTLKPVRDLPEDLARSIKEVDADGGIKFNDKLKAMDQSAKLLGLNVEKLEVSGSLSLKDIIQSADKELKEESNG